MCKTECASIFGLHILHMSALMMFRELMMPLEVKRRLLRCVANKGSDANELQSSAYHRTTARVVPF